MISCRWTEIFVICYNHLRETYRKTKKAVAGLLGLLGSFLAGFTFFVRFLLLLSARSAAFRFPTVLKEKKFTHD